MARDIVVRELGIEIVMALVRIALEFRQARHGEAGELLARRDAAILGAVEERYVGMDEAAQLE